MLFKRENAEGPLPAAFIQSAFFTAVSAPRSASKGRLLHMGRGNEALEKEAVTFLESSQGSPTSGPHSGKRGHSLTWRSIFAFRAADALFVQLALHTGRGRKPVFSKYQFHALACLSPRSLSFSLSLPFFLSPYLLFLSLPPHSCFPSLGNQQWLIYQFRS